ncbi:GAF and ANTAR domain-containing protein [Rhodococcus sp. D2-41]|uniref:GAF and ANTAR domain-containing protein n=1 Tax=Speluncibacter jeojiensis TaxID=2710754 RepID=A0A9X4M294_9ACTN|nr:GAF and ANTAR domain-containing protein [Rhodococcus sp. D2-41]MDG3010889.1 GAF and ANTAR domain-containing protein [Rhodococcus sp. D2-41]MDG3013863.1 GAF and ANTAR domain-containing protein [Corynebacteriales bacterium D3-21]
MASAPGNDRHAISTVWAAVVEGIRDNSSGLAPVVRVCRACVGVLPVDGASISAATADHGREALYASDPVSGRLTSLQFTLGEGPCVESIDAGRPVLVPDLSRAVTSSWPMFAAEVGALDVAAVFAFPIRSGAIDIGTMQMHRRRAGALTAAELSLALRVVDVAAVALLALHSAPGARVDGEWLAALPRDGIAIHQATGILTHQLNIPAKEALTRLRALAFATGRAVDDIARDVIVGRSSLSDPGG